MFIDFDNEIIITNNINEKNFLFNEKRYEKKFYYKKSSIEFFAINYTISEDKCHISYFGFKDGDIEALKNFSNTGFAKKEILNFIKEIKELFPILKEITLHTSPKKILINKIEKSYIGKSFYEMTKWYENVGFKEEVVGSGVMIFKY